MGVARTHVTLMGYIQRYGNLMSQRRMNILGINSVFHELSAALIIDGQVVAASEEERFNRIKHGKPSHVGNPHMLPE